MTHEAYGVKWPLYQEPKKKKPSKVPGIYRLLFKAAMKFSKPIAENVPLKVKRIQSDKLNFDSAESIENEVLAIMAATFECQYKSDSYPKIKPTKANLASYGITSNKPRRAYFQVLWATFKDTIAAIKSGTVKGSVIEQKWAKLTANQIARKYGYNKARQRNKVKTQDDVLQAKYVTRTVGIDKVYAAKDDETNQIEMKMLYQQYMEIYRRMHKADQLALETNKLANIECISFESAFRKFGSEFSEVGITTAKGAKKRFLSLDNRYPELKYFREALKN